MLSLDDFSEIIKSIDGVSTPASKPLDKATHRETNTSKDGENNSYALSPDYLSFRNTWFGQPQPVAYKLIWRAYLEEPIVRACVDITVDAIIGDGYILKGKNESDVKFTKDFFKKINFQSFIQDVVMSLVIYGDAYIEKVRGKDGVVQYLRTVDSSTVRIDYDEHGTPIKYIQRVNHRRVDFYPDEMVHLSLNTIGARTYGISWLQSVLFTLQAKIAAQEFNTSYFRRPGLPRSLYISKNLSDEQNKRVIAGLRQATPQTDIYLNAGNGELTHSLISPNNQDMQFIELMNYLRQEIIAASGVPPLFLGITEGANRANSQIQMEAWDRRKKKLRMMIQDAITVGLLTEANFGFSDVTFKFGDENSRERLKYAQMAQLMSTIPYVTPNQILDTMDQPSLEDDEVRYDSFTGEVDRKTSSVGDTPIYVLQQKQQEAQNAASGSQTIGKKPDNRNLSANPQKSQSRAENAERLNVEQANETRANKSADSDFLKSDPFKTYPYGAVEPEHELLDPKMRQDFRARLRQIAEAQLRVMRGENYEYDDTQQKKPNGPILPPAAKPEPTDPSTPK